MQEVAKAGRSTFKTTRVISFLLRKGVEGTEIFQRLTIQIYDKIFPKGVWFLGMRNSKKEKNVGKITEQVAAAVNPT